MANVGSYLNNASNAARYMAFFDEGNFYNLSSINNTFVSNEA